jgi:hypothetical protein
MVAIYHTFSPCSDPLLSYSCNQHSSLIIATKAEMCQKTCLLSQLYHQVQAVLTLNKWALRRFRMFTLCQSTRRQRKYTSDVLGTTSNIPDTFSLRHWFQHSVTGCASCLKLNHSFPSSDYNSVFPSPPPPSRNPHNNFSSPKEPQRIEIFSVQQTKMQLVAHGNYCSITNCREKNFRYISRDIWNFS